ncbi:hypothetical protein [Paraburkholderia sp. J67]|uniref:hypothetical protein n=1 Tax=Paraburkholderia sp. J67 TaxID=2805435 RepID=UPI002ABD4166|nr:hypothetical protein [Paraburkholderia sp. J67]
MAELARGGSHIASTLTPEGERAAISDIVNDFHRLYGTDDLDVFLELLAQALDARRRPDIAGFVRRYTSKPDRNAKQNR